MMAVGFKAMFNLNVYYSQILKINISVVYCITSLYVYIRVG